MKDFTGLLEQATKLQEKIAKVDQDFQQQVFIGKSGGSLVEVSMKGSGEIINLKFDDSLFKEEEKNILADLVVAASNDAKRKLDHAKKDQMSGLTNGMTLPPGFRGS